MPIAHPSSCVGCSLHPWSSDSPRRRITLGLGCIHPAEANALVAQAQSDLQHVEDAYRALQEQLIVLKHNVSLEQYLWAVSTTRSRSFSVPQARE